LGYGGDFLDRRKADCCVETNSLNVLEPSLFDQNKNRFKKNEMQWTEGKVQGIVLLEESP
jgi:hypothetical protein